ncbi:MAG: anti-sigma factor family protein [Streptosporangiaceae bacterium]
MGDQGWPAGVMAGGGGDCGEMRRALGVYVVGAITPADRSAVDEHLAGCAVCRDELAGLAGLPALLGRVPADEAAAILLGRDPDASRPPLASLLNRAATLRRLRVWPRLAAAAAAGLVIGAGAVAAAHEIARPKAPSAAAAARPWGTAVHGTDARTQASATIRYQARPWGLQLAVQVSGIRTGTRCWLKVTNARGLQVASGSWTVAGGDHGAWYPASSSVPLSAARAFVITTGHGTLVTVPVP